MNSSVFSFSPYLSVFVIVWLLFIQIPSSVGNNIDLFTDCRNKFVCRDISADFPFWGTGRPSACGIPELELKCEKNITKMIINEVRYRVLDINRDRQILRIAREDYLAGFCQPQFANSTFNPMVFETVKGYTNLTFIYGCKAAPVNIPIPGVFTCKIDQVDDQTGYLDVRPIGPGQCYGSVFVPVSVSDFTSSFVNRTALEQDLKKGFEVRWEVDKAACEKCKSFSGVCGIDHVTNQTTCYCPNQSTGSKTCLPVFSPAAAPAIPGKLYPRQENSRSTHHISDPLTKCSHHKTEIVCIQDLFWKLIQGIASFLCLLVQKLC